MEFLAESLRSARLVIQKVALRPLVETLRELRGVQDVHAIGPAVVRLLHKRVCVVAVGIIDGFKA